MDIRIVAVGRVKDKAYAQKIDEYADRIRHDAKCEIVEIKDAGSAVEGKKMLDYCTRVRGYLVALDERGTACTSQAFAKRLASLPYPVVFAVGGPDGLSDEVKRCARERLALSPMTFTHEMARLLLVEQLYRAISILKNRKYHKE